MESRASKAAYDSQVQSQPSAQLSQQPLSQPQSGHPSQQPLSLQQPVVGAAAGPVEANDSAPVERAARAANDQSALVNMMKLTFWLMELITEFTNLKLTPREHALPAPLRLVKLGGASRLNTGCRNQINQLQCRMRWGIAVKNPTGASKGWTTS